VTNLPRTTTEKFLLALFRGFGATDATLEDGGQPRGVVTFGTESNLARALADPPETEWPDEEWHEVVVRAIK